MLLPHQLFVLLKKSFIFGAPCVDLLLAFPVHLTLTKLSMSTSVHLQMLSNCKNACIRSDISTGVGRDTSKHITLEI